MQMAMEKVWEGEEVMRQYFFNFSKFGNDKDESDNMTFRAS